MSQHNGFVTLLPVQIGVDESFILSRKSDMLLPGGDTGEQKACNDRSKGLHGVRVTPWPQIDNHSQPCRQLSSLRRSSRAASLDRSGCSRKSK